MEMPAEDSRVTMGNQTEKKHRFHLKMPQKGQLRDYQLAQDMEAYPVVMPEGEWDLIPFAGGKLSLGATHENDMGFDLIQIHGAIPADCQSDGGLALWQAVNIAGSTEENADELFVQSSNIRGYVVDGAEYGSGKTFGWEAEEQTFVFPEKLKIQNRQFILAGGLNIENVQNGIRMLHPDVVDVSSGVERNGVKDADLIRKFISAVKHC